MELCGLVIVRFSGDYEDIFFLDSSDPPDQTYII